MWHHTFYLINKRPLSFILKTIHLKHIYCLSGLGADEKVFSKLDFKDNSVTFLQWLIPEKNESIEDYAKRLSTQITSPNPILIGLSFGGIMCIEIAKLIAVEKIIVLSSIKTRSELPLWMKAAGRLYLNRIFPMRSFKLIEPLEDYNLGVETVEEVKMVHLYRRTIDRRYTEWAINSILHWNNRNTPSNLIHIHGDRDRIFSIKKVKPHHVIKNGGHFMVMNKATEINIILKTIVDS